MLHKLSYLSLHIDLLKCGLKCGDATGFLVERNQKIYLCTNKHVFMEGDRLDQIAPTLNSPDACDIWFYERREEGTGWRPYRITLHDKNGNKTWCDNKKNPLYDVAYVEIPWSEEIDFYHIKMDLDAINRITYPGKKICIIGFPFGLTHDSSIPIWKTGHLAADMNYNWNGDPCFVIDCETSEGMSGAPVFDIENDGSGHESHYIPRFIGIYSGRVEKSINKNSMFPRLAKVWKVRSIDDTFKSNGL